jgi:hypothetical protein
LGALGDLLGYFLGVAGFGVVYYEDFFRFGHLLLLKTWLGKFYIVLGK